MLPVPQKNQVFEFQKNQPVMEQVKKQRQPAEAMDVIQILEKSTGNKENAVKLYNVLADLVNTDPNVRVMRSGNTLFVYYNNKDGSVGVAMETADSPREIMSSLKEFKIAMKTAGFKTAVFNITNPQLPRLLEMSGIPIKTQPTNVPSEDGMPQMIGIGEF